MLLVIIAGIATAINFIIILHKLRQKNFKDAAIDAATATVISGMFVGTLTGMSIGMTASAFISAYLWLFPFGNAERGIDILRSRFAF